MIKYDESLKITDNEICIVMMATTKFQVYGITKQTNGRFIRFSVSYIFFIPKLLNITRIYPSQ